MEGCDTIHINLSKLDEALATEEIVKVAKQKGIKLISFVSGSTVAEENRWFWMIDNKFKAEQSIINSGIHYLIFRPSWFLSLCH
ncbi:MAG: NAD(P)H-binding protein [Chloroflexia bacterium]|nr:NAD(P)H-binding protein [Chloroflexia bacterium]